LVFVAAEKCLAAVRAPPGAGSPAAFSQFLFTPPATPLPADAGASFAGLPGWNPAIQPDRPSAVAVCPTEGADSGVDAASSDCEIHQFAVS